MQSEGKAGLSATSRLRRRKDFKQVYQNGKRWKGELWILYTLPRRHPGRLGIAIPRSWGNAVQRNRMKRLLRETFRLHRSVFGQCDVVIRPLPASKGLDYHAVAQQLIRDIRAAKGVHHAAGNDLPYEGRVPADAE